jgi:hypothetical protein
MARLPASDPYFHDAFISYSRKDRPFAALLQRTLGRYTPPRGLPVARRRLDVFRDEEDFTGTEYFLAVRRHLEGTSTPGRREVRRATVRSCRPSRGKAGRGLEARVQTCRWAFAHARERRLLTLGTCPRASSSSMNRVTGETATASSEAARQFNKSIVDSGGTT